MRVVLDGRIVLPRPTGAGRYVMEIARRLPRLSPELRLDVLLLPVHKRTETSDLLQDAGASITYCDVSVASVRQWAAIPWMLHRIRPDLYHYPFLDLPYVQFPTVVTIYDLNPVLLPEYFARQAALRRFAAARLLRSTLRRCRLAIVISDTVRRLLTDNYPEASGRTRTIRLGVDPARWSLSSSTDSAPAGEQLPEEGPWRARPYVLYVGVDRPQKNLVRLVRAFCNFCASQQWSTDAAPYLWLAGVGDGSRELRLQLEQSGCGDSVRLTGALTDAQLVQAYGHARVVAYVSTSEGFGLPILEAFAAGVPVVAANASSLPEVAGDAAILVSPADETDIARGLALTWFDETLRRVLRERGQHRLAAFSWDATARETLQAYRDAILLRPQPSTVAAA